jgi:hypothetical protein
MLPGSNRPGSVGKYALDFVDFDATLVLVRFDPPTERTQWLRCTYLSANGGTTRL